LTLFRLFFFLDCNYTKKGYQLKSKFSSGKLQFMTNSYFAGFIVDSD